MGSAFPILSRLWKESPERLDRATELSFRAMLWAGLPLAALLHLYAAPILDLLFGDDFVAGGPIMRLLAWSIPAAFLGSVLHNRLFSASQQKAAAWLALLAASANVVLNLWLIPRHQGVGAAAATLVSYALVPLFALGSAHTRSLGVTALRCVLRPGLVVLGGMAVVWLLDPAPVLGVMVLLTVYLTGLVATREWGPRELALVQRTLRGR
jgi:O-antigen/teichoic acid export membrane protein